jgi:hypothetical protein
LRETQAKPRLMVLATALSVALVFAALAVFAAKARASEASFAHLPPKAILMKDSQVLQVRGASGGSWFYYQDGGWSGGAGDNFGEYLFPKADEVEAGTRLHVRLAKPERPSIIDTNAYPRVRNGEEFLPGKVPAGQKRRLESTLRRVEQDGKTVAWDVFFRVNEPGRHYYLVVHAAWKRVPGTHVSYGDPDYAFHVTTRE